jgi:polyhydroxybutyrate depolymerase
MKKIIVRVILIIISIIVSITLVVASLFVWVNKTNGEIKSSGQVRKYLLYVPGTYDPGTPTPLIISMHGFVEWPAHQMEISRWNDLADENGFIVVYPSGTEFPLRWYTYDQPDSIKDLMQDVNFISDLIDELDRDYNIDKARIYANGLSNGAGMSFLLACKLSDRITAIGGVAGAYLLPWSDCTPSRPMPVILFHGTDDPIVPYLGGDSNRSGYRFPVISEWIGVWAGRNGCADAVIELPPIGEVSGIKYTNCEQNADVVLYTIHGGGHTWPGGEPLPEFIAGHTTQDIDASSVMWEFFQQYSLK